MNGFTLFIGYLLVGAGISLTTAPPKASLLSRLVMVPLWAVFFAYAAVDLAIRRGRNL